MRAIIKKIKLSFKPFASVYGNMQAYGDYRVSSK